MKVSGHIVDILNERIFKGSVNIEDDRITSITEHDNVPEQFLIPGFIDSHVHIESSMLVPSEFARLAVVHGTVATVSDPHEIGNVLGLEGVNFMIENGQQTLFKFYFGAPSCVPATTFETAGATIDANDIEVLLQRNEVKYLAEMMNWPGVLHHDPVVMEKIAIAKRLGKVIDGHAPGLRGEQAKQYASAGMSTDHECFTKEEALDKLACGMSILIREGSAARNFDALVSLIDDYPEKMMFCSDDKHPDNLVEGHINLLVKRALDKGLNIFKILRAACVNPVQHYKLDVGLLRVGDAGDFIVVDDLKNLNVKQTYIGGKLVAENGSTFIPSVKTNPLNQFIDFELTREALRLKATAITVEVIEALDGQLITNRLTRDALVADGHVLSDVDQDVLKLVVVNRYAPAKPAIAFIKNFGLTRGAIASSVAHDSHNVIALGVDDNDIYDAIKLVFNSKGGVSAVGDGVKKIVALPVAGLMSGEDGYKVASDYKAIDAFAKQLGSTLQSPFMTLSFMALLVIPSLKLSDKGLFHGDQFSFVDVFSTKK